MTRDRRVGPGQWRTCPQILDKGVSSPSRRAPPGFSLGSVHWYYYRLNGHIEQYNHAELTTTGCPFLPGQTVNVLEIPSERDGFGPEDGIFTLDPNDKYRPIEVKRSITTSAIHHPKALAAVGPVEALPDIHHASPTLRRSRSISAMFKRLRRTKSACSPLESDHDVFSGSANVPPVPPVPPKFRAVRHAVVRPQTPIRPPLFRSIISPTEQPTHSPSVLPTEPIRTPHSSSSSCMSASTNATSIGLASSTTSPKPNLFPLKSCPPHPAVVADTLGMPQRQPPAPHVDPLRCSLPGRSGSEKDVQSSRDSELDYLGILIDQNESLDIS